MRQVHADLADAAERREHQFLRGSGHQACASEAENIAGRDVVIRPLSCIEQQPSRFVQTFKTAARIRVPAIGRGCPDRALRRARANRRGSARSLRLCSHCASRRCIACDSAVNSTSGVTFAPSAARSVAG